MKKVEIKETESELLTLALGGENELKRRRAMSLYIYKSGQGGTYKQIADLLKADRHTVSHWFKHYSKHGLASLLDLRGPGRQTGEMQVFPEEAVKQLKSELDNPENSFNGYTDVQERMSKLCGFPAKYRTVHQLVSVKWKAKLKRPRPSHIKKDLRAEALIKKRAAPAAPDGSEVS
jgi:transposase